MDGEIDVDGESRRRGLSLAAAGMVVGVLAGVFAAACGAPAPSSSGSASPAAPTPTPEMVFGCHVAVAWANFAEERWAKWHEPAIKKALGDAGATYEWSDAKSVAETQASDIDSFVAGGARVIAVVPQDAQAILPAVRRALAAGVAVIAYQRVIPDPRVLFIGSDQVESGRLQARAVLAAKPAGRYVIVKGHEGSLEAEMLSQGIQEVLRPALLTGAVRVVGETYTTNWDPFRAQSQMEQFLTQTNSGIDAAIVENDGMAGGIVAALSAVGLDGKVAVSGKDAEAAGLNRVARGTQTIDVWEDDRLLGKAVGEAAVELCRNPDIASVNGVKPFTPPGTVELTSILVPPKAITRDNLGAVIDSGWIEKKIVCAEVDAANAPPACR